MIYFKFLLALIFLFISSVFSQAQTFADKKYYLVDSLELDKIGPSDRNIIDSCLNVFHNTKDDTLKIKAITKIIDFSWDDHVWPKYNDWEYHFILKKLKKEKNPKIIKRLKKSLSSVINNMGVLAINKGKTNEALNYFFESLALDKEVGTVDKLATAMSNIGYIYSKLGDIPKALDYYHEALKIQERNDDKVGISRSYNNIGFIYQDIGDAEKAIEFYTQSLKIRKEINDKMGIAVSLTNLAEVYEESGDLEKAKNYYQESHELYVEIGYQSGIASTLNNIGYIYQIHGDFNCKDEKIICAEKGMELALDYYTRAMKIQREADDKFGLSSTLYNIGRINLIKNNRSEAKKAAVEAYEMSNTLGYPDNIQKAAGLLKEIFYLEGNFKTAYQYFQEEIKMRDSLENEQSYKEIQKRQAKYFYEKIHQSDSIAFEVEKQKKQVEIEKQQGELQAKRNQQIVLIIGFIVLMIFSVFLFNRFKVTNRQKKTIETQKIIVEEKNQEILDSILYAKRIQNAILPTKEALNNVLKNGFILYKPKDIVAGDFYWLEEIDNKTFFAVGDCTGHGVPGAMVSVICSGALNRAAKEFRISDPGKILDKVQELVLETFEKSDDNVKDGMDISLCMIEKSEDEKTFLSWSGANNPLWILRNNELIEISPDKQPIGVFSDSRPFTTHKMGLFKNDTLYLFTDGFTDQFGGPKGKKFKQSNLKKLILENTNSDPATFNALLEDTFNEWKSDLEQVDDVCIMGVRI